MSDIPFSTYAESCPNCGGDIDALRLVKGLVCSKCMPKKGI
nr:hypothetical protein [Sulfuracidifex metallicus]